MAQGEFTKQEAKFVEGVVAEMFNAIPKKKQIEYLGHLNDVYLFLAAAQKVAPDSAEQSAEAATDAPA